MPTPEVRELERELEDTKRRQVEEAVQDLYELDEQLGEVIDSMSRAEDKIEGGAAGRLRQVRAQLETLRNSDHGWLGGSMYTIQGVIDELEAGEDE
jgi:NAD-specific glutamate dehydrogenase